jgi:tRNA-specific 2-thiouridylase
MAAGEGRLRAVFDEPQQAVTPGQIAVFYDGDTVLASGVIGTGPGAGSI